MSKLKLFIVLVIFLLFDSCVVSKWKVDLISEGNVNDAVSNVITDFLNTSSLSKKDTVFGVLITDTNDGVIKVGICGAVNKIYPRKESKVGTYDAIFPTRYLIRDEKLFYWSDTTQVITQEIVSVLEKYNQIDTLWWSSGGLPDYVIDDGKEGIIYYICKNNLKNYKKTGSNTIRKHYNPPKLKCE